MAVMRKRAYLFDMDGRLVAKRLLEILSKLLE